MKRLFIVTILILSLTIYACKSGNGVSTAPTGSIVGAVTEGFPSGFNAAGLGGFGGDKSKDQAGNRAAVQRIPIILLHGNSGTATHRQWGWSTWYSYLKAAGYNDSEIWAPSYLGGGSLEDHCGDVIGPVRQFIDNVIAYLGVAKINIVGHSLGGMMVTSYLKGLKAGTVSTWENSNNRFDKVNTVITIASANYGLTGMVSGDFKQGSAWEVSSHRYNGVTDDTPHGLNDTAQMTSYNSSWNVSSSLDDNTINYIGVTAEGDYCDSAVPGTSRLNGANLNIKFNCGSGLTGHEQILKTQAVFDAILPYLGEVGPQEAPPVVSISPNGGEFYKGQTATVSINASNDPSSFQYKINDGAWQNYTGEFTITETTTISAKASNQYGDSEVVTVTITKVDIPPYETANGTATEHYMAGRLDTTGYTTMGGKYGYTAKFDLYKVEGSSVWTDVKPGGGVEPPPAELPVVSVSPNGATFETSQSVSITATNDPTSIEYRLNGGAWTTYSGSFTVTETTTVEAKATNSAGTSQVVSATFTKSETPPPPPVEQVTSTLYSHCSSGRISWAEYSTYYFKYGANTFTMYKVDGVWTDVQP